MKRKNVSIVRKAPPTISAVTVERSAGGSNGATPHNEPLRVRRSGLSSAPKFLIAGGVLLIALSLVQLFSTKSTSRVQAQITAAAKVGEDANTPSPIASATVDASPIIGESFSLFGGKKQTRPNPSVPWLEMVFCRGRQTSTGCSGKAYHPYLRWWETYAGDSKMNIYWKEKAARAIMATFGNGIAEE